MSSNSSMKSPGSCAFRSFFAGSELFRHGGENRLFQGISRQPEVEAIGVYLDQLVIALVEERFQSY